MRSKDYFQNYYLKNKERILAYQTSRKEAHNKDSLKYRQAYPEKVLFATMIQRCTNPKVQRFKHYGGRGIKVLYKSVDELIADIGRKPGPYWSINRIDNDGHYMPGNCEWKAPFTNVRHKVRKNV